MSENINNRLQLIEDKLNILENKLDSLKEFADAVSQSLVSSVFHTSDLWKEPKKTSVPRAISKRFTKRSNYLFELANQEACKNGHEYVGTESLLMAMILEGHGIAGNVLKNLGLNEIKIREGIEKYTRKRPAYTVQDFPLTPRLKKVIEYAIEEARDINHNYIGTEHLLLGMTREADGFHAQILQYLNVGLTEIRDETLRLLGAEE